MTLLQNYNFNLKNLDQQLIKGDNCQAQNRRPPTKSITLKNLQFYYYEINIMERKRCKSCNEKRIH